MGMTWVRGLLSGAAIGGMIASGVAHAAPVGGLSGGGDMASLPVVLGAVLLVFGASRLRRRMGITDEEQDF